MLQEFISKFAERYDRDPRIASVQVGFGLWSEYHIYDGPMELGKTFPTMEYQAEFAIHLASHFRETPGMISVLPQSIQCDIESGGTNPILNIECDRLVPGQRIEFDTGLARE